MRKLECGIKLDSLIFIIDEKNSNQKRRWTGLELRISQVIKYYLRKTN